MATQRILAGAVLVLLGSSVLFGSVTAPGQSAPAATAGDKADALSEAARKGDAAMVKKLLDEGVDVNTKYRYDVTALFYACDRGHLEVVKVLLDHGADVNTTDSFYHGTALGMAARPAMGRKPQHAEIVGLLLKHGARGKEMALRAAVSDPDPAMLKVVLEQGGFAPDILSGALETAKKGSYQDMLAMLEQAGAKPFVDLKMDETQLARYAGAYRNAVGNEVVFSVTDGQLTGNLFGQRVTLAARNETTFRIVDSPGPAVTFTLEQGKATAVVVGQGANATHTRVEGK